jgi:hypothetical protein
MKNVNPIFIPYDDGDLEHVENGPDYGQIDSSSAWNEVDSLEYTDYVDKIEEKILAFSHLKITKF